MEKVRLNNQRLTERRRKAEEDETDFERREAARKQTDAKKRLEERKKRVEAEKNRRELEYDLKHPINYYKQLTVFVARSENATGNGN